MKRIFALTLGFGLAACVSDSSPPRPATTALACPAGTQPMTRVEFFMGGNVGEPGGVPDAEWQRFLETEVTPRFPDGFSVADIYGQWRNAMGAAEAERSKNLIVILNDVPAYATRITSLRAAYRARFRQQSVLLVETPVCAGF